MNDQDKIKRSLMLLLMLSGKRRYTISEIIEKIDVAERTVYRYFETFKLLGFLVKCEDKHYYIDRLTSGYHDISELLYFSPEEAYILDKALHSINEDNVVKQQLVEKLYSLYQAREVAEMIISKANSEIVTTIAEAISGKFQVVLGGYHSAHSNQVANRLVEPFGFTYNYLSIWCYEPESHCCKLFKTSRIESVKITGDRWQYEKHHVKGHIDHFRISSFDSLPVRLRLSMRAASLLCEEYPLAEKSISKESEGYFVYSANVANYEGVGRFVLGLPEDVEVLETADFKNFLNKKFTKRIY